MKQKPNATSQGLGQQGYNHCFEFSNHSLEILAGVKPELQSLVSEALRCSEVDFMVIAGKRNAVDEERLRKEGKSWTTHSKHLTGDAIDVVPYPIDFNDLDKYKRINEAFQKASEKTKIPYRWGGDWNKSGDYRDEIQRGSYDGGHFELL